MPQHHPAFLTSFSTDASAGTAAWSTPSNAAGSDGSYATVAFSGSANEQSQYLVCTGPAFRRAFQSGETPTGITIAIEARDAAGDSYTGSAGIVLAEARLVVGGVIQTGASNLAADDQVGDSSTPERHQIVLGGPEELWGVSLAEADIGSGLGVALRFACIDATARTLQVDSVRLIAWGAKAASCVVESAGNASGEAPYPVIFSCAGSSWADALPHQIDFRHAITGPAGWTATITDPRPGATVNGQTLSLGNTPAGLQPHAWGMRVGFIADGPGTYTDTPAMFERSGSSNTLTIAASPASVTIAASTRTRYHVSSSGSDSTGDGSEGAPWATLKGAIDNLEALSITSNWDIVFAEGDTVAYTQRTVIDGHTNFAIYTDGTGDLATMDQAASVSFLEMTNCSEARIYRLAIQGHPATYTRGMALTGSANDHLAIWQVTADGISSFAEWASSPDDSFLHVYQANTITGFTRYVVYIDAGHDFACVGNDSNTDVAAAGEGHYRFQGHYGQGGLGDPATSGQGVWLMGNRTRSTTTHSCFRHGWSDVAASFNSFEGVTSFGLSHNPQTVDHELQVGHRFEANYLAALGWGYASSHVHLGSNVVEFATGVSIAGAGTSEAYELECNTLLFNNPAIGSLSAVSTQSTSTEHRCRSMAWRGNLWSSDQDLSAWTGAWWRNGITTPATRSFNGQWQDNVYGQRASWREENIAYSTAAAWNARADVDGEVVIAGLYGASRPQATSDFAPDEQAFPAVRAVDPAQVAGTFINYQGWLRDPGAAAWLAGAWGDEPAPAPAGPPLKSRTCLRIGVGIGF